MERKSLQEAIRECHVYGSFKLPNGTVVDEYFDLHSLLLSSYGVNIACAAITDATKHLAFESVGCVETCPTPLVGAFLAQSPLYLDGFMVRKTSKGYGTDRLVEGNICPDDRVLILEDVTSTGASVMHAIKTVEALGAVVVRILAIVNRHEGCDGLLSNYSFRWLFNKDEVEGYQWTKVKQ